MEAISWAGSGYNGLFYMGLVKGMLRERTRFRDIRFVGCSSGSTIGPLFIMLDALATQDVGKKGIVESEAISNVQSMIDTVVQKLLADWGHIKASQGAVLFKTLWDTLLGQLVARLEIKREAKLGPPLTGLTDRVFIGLTEVPSFGLELRTNFPTLESLVAAIHASSHVPLLCPCGGLTVSLPPQVGQPESKRYLDGGVADNQPLCPGREKTTLKVSAFDNNGAHMWPSMADNTFNYNLNPPPVKYLRDLYACGERDCKVLLGLMGRPPSSWTTMWRSLEDREFLEKESRDKKSLLSRAWYRSKKVARGITVISEVVKNSL